MQSNPAKSAFGPTRKWSAAEGTSTFESLADVVSKGGRVPHVTLAALRKRERDSARNGGRARGARHTLSCIPTWLQKRSGCDERAQRLVSASAIGRSAPGWRKPGFLNERGRPFNPKSIKAMVDS